jgi:SSS family transporter
MIQVPASGTFMPPQYAGQDSFFGKDPPLSEGVGFVIVIGFGLFFSVFTSLLVYLENKYAGANYTSEYFNTAGRNVKTGLTAAVIVSQWTWAATLLQSSNVAWSYGVSGPFWYASGASIQVLLFGILAIEVKRKAPTAHTVCEMVNARWGKTAHITFLIFSFLANIIVTSMLLLGGAATVNALTGMDLKLAGFLIPWGVIAYTMAGGLKATFLASYIHTGVIFVILVTFVFSVYIKFYSTDDIHTMLEFNSKMTKAQCEHVFSNSAGVTFFNDGETRSCGPVKDNEDGAYLTMLSKDGLIFGIINIVGNFGTVFVDQSYWQSAIAAKPASAHKGYLLGGLIWFTIPFALATSLGLASIALQLPLTGDEAGAGLVPPAVATFLFGKAGSVMITVMLFMAIVSTGSAESVAVSSLVAYDIYRTYWNPKATGKDILRVSRIVIFVFGASMGLLSIILNEMNINLGWVYLFMGIVIGSAVAPLWFMLMWKDCTATAAVSAAIFGQFSAVAVWLITCSMGLDGADGKITVDNLGGNYPMLYGNVTALCSSALICIVVSKMNPQNYDFKSMREISQVEDDSSGLDASDYTDEKLVAAQKWIKKWGYGMTTIVVVVWPCLSLPAGVFTKDYFAFWVFVAIAWGFAASLIIIVLPLYESKDQILAVLQGIFGVTSRTEVMKEATVEKSTDL